MEYLRRCLHHELEEVAGGGAPADRGVVAQAVQVDVPVQYIHNTLSTYGHFLQDGVILLGFLGRLFKDFVFIYILKFNLVWLSLVLSRLVWFRLVCLR